MAQIVASAPASISTPRPEVEKLLHRYKLIRDVIEQHVESLGEEYLPCPSGKVMSDRTGEEKIRYQNYRTRAIFYNFCARTLIGFIGQIFSRDAEVKIPTVLESLVKDVTGDGLTLEQLAKEACAEALSMGRFGLLVDYPKAPTDAGFSKADVDVGIARPVIIPYKTESIIDWDFKKVGAKWVLSFLVLVETHDYRGDDGALNTCNQYRVLDLGENGDGNYRQRVWREGDTNGWVDDEESEIKADGEYLKEIPFTFIGAINNDSKPDMPPFYDMAKINIGHYRNSADYEESVFFIGQPTFVAIGIKQKWWEEVLHKTLRFGSRHGIALEAQSDAKILQAQPNILAKEAMDAKQEQLAKMGAEFLKETSTQRTATEAAIDDSARTSAIANVAKNVSAAFQFALEWCAVFQGVSEETVSFKLNSEFDLVRMTESERAQLLKEFQANVITWSEYRSALHKAGIATQDDKEAQAELEEKQANELAQMAAEFAVNNPDEAPGNNNNE